MRGPSKRTAELLVVVFTALHTGGINALTLARVGLELLRLPDVLSEFGVGDVLLLPSLRGNIAVHVAGICRAGTTAQLVSVAILHGPSTFLSSGCGHNCPVISSAIEVPKLLKTEAVSHRRSKITESVYDTSCEPAATGTSETAAASARIAIGRGG